MFFEKKNTDKWYGKQVFGGIYGYVLGFVQTGHGQTFQYTNCPYHIWTGGHPGTGSIVASISICTGIIAGSILTGVEVQNRLLWVLKLKTSKY
jgi:hypothetical protein